jgi:hypothetical protein
LRARRHFDSLKTKNSFSKNPVKTCGINTKLFGTGTGYTANKKPTWWADTSQARNSVVDPELFAGSGMGLSPEQKSFKNKQFDDLDYRYY